MIKLTYRISDDAINVIEAYHNESNNLANIMVHFLRSNLNNPEVCNTESFNKYEEKYINSIIEYSFSIDIVTDMIPPKILDYFIDWVIDFESKSLIIRLREEILDKYKMEDIICEMRRLDIIEG